jgi:hypothetical protein
MISLNARAAAHALAIAGAITAGTAAHAGTYNVTVSEGVTNGQGFDTAAGNPFTGPGIASATFNFTGPISFDNTASQNGPGAGGDLNSAFGFSATNIGNYAGSGSVTYGGQQVANYASLTSFLASSGSASGFAYGSYYTFDLGTLAAGTILSVFHDDGISVFEGGNQVGTSVSGPTSATNDVVDISNTGDVVLRYARENGTPSVLEVGVPEPVSWAVFAIGLAGLFSLRRPKRA